MAMLNNQRVDIFTGWWFYPSWKILVNGKDYPIYYGKYKMFETTNQFIYLLHGSWNHCQMVRSGATIQVPHSMAQWCGRGISANCRSTPEPRENPGFYREKTWILPCKRVDLAWKNEDFTVNNGIQWWFYNKPWWFYHEKLRFHQFLH